MICNGTIFIQLIVCYLSPPQGSGIENTLLVELKSYTTANYERSYIYKAKSSICSTLKTVWYIDPHINACKKPYTVRMLQLTPILPV